MATSAPRLAANAANAQLSTGPRTAEGKARSSQNALKHGLTSRDLVVGPAEQAEFDELLADFQAEVAPQGAVQQALFDQLVASAWSLRRARRLEAELCAGLSPAELLADEGLQRKLDRLSRHHARIERSFHRCLKELRALQTNAVIHASFDRKLRETVPPLASATEIAKRTQWLDRNDPLGLALMAKTLERGPLPCVQRAAAAGSSTGTYNESFRDE